MANTPKIVDQIACECLLNRTRMLNRIVTGIFDDAFRPFGLKATQLNLLVAVAKLGPIRRVDLGKRLHFDPSTLTRNLKVMLDNGWIEETAAGKDGRGSPLLVTNQGLDLLNQIGPSWQTAQTRAQQLMGEEGSALLSKLAADVAATAPG